MYTILDIKTGATIGRYSTYRRAARKADKLDSEYGAVRYVVKRKE